MMCCDICKKEIKQNRLMGCDVPRILFWSGNIFIKDYKFYLCKKCYNKKLKEMKTK